MIEIKEAWEIWNDVPERDPHSEATKKWVSLESLREHILKYYPNSNFADLLNDIEESGVSKGEEAKK